MNVLSVKQALLGLLVACVSLSLVQSRLSGECAMLCNDLRTEVLTLEMCREAKRTLPRPKVGDFCSTAMEQGFSDACVALCMEQPPVARVAQTCRSAAIEMPRPTVRRWCEHGYTVAFSKTMRDLSTYFSPTPTQAQAQAQAETRTQGERAFQEREGDRARRALESDSPGAAAYHTNTHTHTNAANSNNNNNNSEKRAVLATIPVTLDDERTQELRVHAGETAEEAVVAFCRTHVGNEVGVCIRQLLPVVLEKLQELDIAA